MEVWARPGISLSLATWSSQELLPQDPKRSYMDGTNASQPPLGHLLAFALDPKPVLSLRFFDTVRKPLFTVVVLSASEFNLTYGLKSLCFRIEDY